MNNKEIIIKKLFEIRTKSSKRNIQSEEEFMKLKKSMDSLQSLELLVLCENKFNIVIPDTEIQKFTVANFKEMVEKINELKS
ncbi:phosphopantetheine-binding protein [Lactobacillus kefiranofaciens]|uniref:phosphopantetheine-binding protein n=1 Tax=Lactobacillus kefiranofaciens TaxID=267818 RepID=UPI0023EB873C|nr:phosphopantetheine-binding protein [Lactobacillus kefiranofaciens]MDF4142072.1 phosphopantetheine-binding protein [Lactobacillus kefiranofaciens]MDH5101442.1 phosphopantetheine-binding protein [Lactobacillus kefiranofaciens]